MRFRVLIAIAMLAALLPIQTSHAADPPMDWHLTSTAGHFYRQTADVDGFGYIVSNDDDIAFWDFYRRLGPTALGYPISQRFTWNGRVAQVFQRGVLQASSVDDSVELVNLLDLMSTLGYDEWLEATYGIPRMGDPNDLPSGETPDEVARARLALLDADPKIAAFYYKPPDPFRPADPIAVFGMPTSQVVEVGAARVIRLQRGAIQLWTEDVPWAKAGDVTSVQIGSIGTAAGLFPDGMQWRAVEAPEGPPPRPPFDENELVDPKTVQIPDGYRWVDVDLSRQRVYAYVDDYPIFWAPVTTGRLAGGTPVGRHRIFSRIFNETMDSSTLGIPRNGPGGWYLPNVYYTQYFYPGGYALHTNYWAAESVFGNVPSSAGCVGMRIQYAEFFWNFANIGTEVVVHY